MSGTMAGLYYSGLDYAAAEALLRARRVKGRTQLMEDIRIMELAALPELNRRV